MNHKQCYENNKRINDVIFNLLSETISDKAFILQEFLQHSGENLIIVQAFMTEFYLHFIVQAKRPLSGHPCKAGINCMCLRIHAILRCLETRLVGERKRLGVSTECFVPCAEKTSACIGEHSETQILSAFNQAERLFEHPFFTPNLCHMILETLLYEVRKHDKTNLRTMLLRFPCGRELRVKVPPFNKLPSIRERIEAERATLQVEDPEDLSLQTKDAERSPEPRACTPKHDAEE